MNPEQQRIAIAEACGWKARHDANKCDWVTIFRCGACGEIGHSNCYGNGQGAISFSCSVSPCCNEAAPPDYLHDLNAMHEAEASLFGTNYWVACKYERLITRMASSWAWHATASQRAEAFLRTIGKWKECK
jgi:hypothetical protein